MSVGIICIWQRVLKGTYSLRIFSACIILSVLAMQAHSSFAQKKLLTQASCTIVYSLQRSANEYLNDEISQLKGQIEKQNIHFIDLNNWGKTPPHLDLSGRLRNQLRQQYDLPSNINQAIVLNKNGKLISRFTGSVTLVNAMLDCP